MRFFCLSIFSPDEQAGEHLSRTPNGIAGMFRPMKHGVLVMFLVLVTKYLGVGWRQHKKAMVYSGLQYEERHSTVVGKARKPEQEAGWSDCIPSQESEQEIGPGYRTSTPAQSDPLLVGLLHLKILQPSETVMLAGIKCSNARSCGRHFTLNPQHVG